MPHYSYVADLTSLVGFHGVILLKYVCAIPPSRQERVERMGHGRFR
jgi:hypothetical protein